MEIIIKTILIMGLQASILAVVIMGFRKIFKNVPKIFTYVLWLMLLTRLVVPAFFESEYSIIPSPDTLSITDSANNADNHNVSANDNATSAGNHTADEGIMQSADNMASSDELEDGLQGTATDGIVNSSDNELPDSSQNSGQTPLNSSDNTTDTNQTINTGGTSSVANSSTTATANVSSDLSFWQQSWFIPVVFAIWCTGAVAVLLVTLLQYIAMKRKLTFAIRIKDNIWECETVTSPFVMGFVKPKIYLPLSLPEDDREYILLHEQMHIKHLDHIVRLFMTLATAIHWCNPIVWLAMHLMKKDMEMLCDESATRAKEMSYRKAYSMTLVKYAAKSSGLSPVLSFGESNTEGRVKHLMLLKKPKFYVSIATVIAMCFCLINCGAKPTDNDSQTTDNTETESTKASYIPDETVTLTIYSDLCSYAGIQEGWFADIIKEKFNVELNLLMANNELGENQYAGDYDIIMGVLSDVYTSAMDEGYILDFNSYDTKQYMPYITENLQASYVSHTNDSGEHIYGIRSRTSLPGDYCNDSGLYTWDLRFDYYGELGKPEISNINDWLNVLEQMKNAHPVNASGDETYGVSYFSNWSIDGDPADTDMLYGVKTYVSAYYGYEAYGMGFYDWTNDKYYGALYMADDGSYGPYIQMLKVHNELYKKGLLDPASETQSYEECHAKVTNNQVFSSIMGYMGNNINEYMYPVIPDEANLLTYGLGSSNWCMAVDSETEYPELCMAIIDYLYTPEGMLTMLYGPQGDCWDYDENGLTYLTELGLSCVNDMDTLFNGERFGDGFPKFNSIPYYTTATNPRNGESYNWEYWKNTASTPANDTESSWREWTASSSIQNYIHDLEPYAVAPVTDLSADISDSELAQKYEAISDAIVTMSWEAIKASSDKEFDSIIKDMIEKATAAGYEELVEYYKGNIKALSN